MVPRRRALAGENAHRFAAHIVDPQVDVGGLRQGQQEPRRAARRVCRQHGEGAADRQGLRRGVGRGDDLQRDRDVERGCVWVVGDDVQQPLVGAQVQAGAVERHLQIGGLAAATSPLAGVTCSHSGVRPMAIARLSCTEAAL